MNPVAQMLPQAAHFAQMQGAQLAIVLGIMVFFGTWGGHIFQRLHIPQVVGYFIIGILIGNSGFQLLRPDVVKVLNPVTNIALSFIGFLVGGELKGSVIKKNGKQFVSILIFEALTPALLVCVLVTAVEYLFTGDFTRSACIGLLLGAICSSTAPEATTNVLQEYRTRGPLTTMTYGIVAMDDAAALILYAIASTIAAPLLGGHTASFGAQMLEIGRDIFGSIAVGLAFGAIVMLIIRNLMSDEGRVLSFMLGMLLLSTGLCDLVNLDNILASMAIGFFIANFAPRNVQKIFTLTNKFTPPIYVLFFVVVGAKLDIWVMKPLLLILAVVYVIGRTAGKAIGSWFGAWITKAPETVQKYMKFCLLSQAGVAIGLSVQAGNDFPDSVGSNILLVVTFTTFCVELIGPVFVKYGVTKGGEVGMNVTEEDIKMKSKVSDVTWGSEKACDPASPAIVKDTATICTILESFESHHNQTFAVSGADGRLTGVITLEHLKETLLIGDMAENMLAMDIMDKPEYTCTPDVSLPDIYRKFSETDTEAIPIVDAEGKPLGMIEKFAVDHYLHTKIIELERKLQSMGA